jgi:hypothetical protein
MPADDIGVGVMQIETAYDIVLMERMKARLTGETRVSQDVRFADVPKTKPAPPVRLDRPSLTEKRAVDSL